MKSLSPGYVKLIWFFLGLILFAFAFFINPFGLEPRQAQVLAVAVLMLAWWLTEALPMPVVALVPLFLFPLTGLMKIDEAAAPYGSSVVFLFLGGFTIGLAMEKWNLHRRIAMNIVRITGTNANGIILGFSIATAFMSMWLSNTATTMMMYPIAVSVMSLVEGSGTGRGNVKNFSLVLMLTIAYASNIGGIATVIGTPPNVVLSGLMKERYGYEVAFVDWMLLCTPLAICLLAVMHLLLVHVLFPNRMGKNATSRELIEAEVKQLGPITRPEIMVCMVFGITALLWITRVYVNDLFAALHWAIKLDDTLIALFALFLLFFIPVNVKQDKFLLEWSDTSKLAWGILLLFGGGLCLAKALEDAGLIKLMGDHIAKFSGNQEVVLLISLTLFAVFLSELMSNVALVTVFVPVVLGTADAMGVNPLYLALPVTLGASTAFMLPMGTPPNAIVYASGKIKVSQMARAGFLLNIVSSLLIALFVYFLLRLVIPPIPGH